MRSPNSQEAYGVPGNKAIIRPVGQSIGVQGIAQSGSSGSFTDASGTSVPVTNMSVSLACSGRPVEVFLMPYTSGGSYIGVSNSSGTQCSMTASLLRNNIEIASFRCQLQPQSGSTSSIRVPSSAVYHSDFSPGYSTNTYSLKVTELSNCTASVINCVLLAREF